MPNDFDSASHRDSSFYARLLQRRVELGDSRESAYAAMAEAYLAGRPAGSNRCKIRQADRDADFWLSRLWLDAPDEALSAEPFVLALTQYLQRCGASAPELLRHVAERAPCAFKRAVRYSLVFVRRESVRWQEIERIGARSLPDLQPFFAVCDALERELGECERLASEAEDAVTSMHPLDILGFASLFAFEHLLPPLLNVVSEDAHTTFEAGALAISDLLRSTVRAADDTAFAVTEESIATRMRETVSPFLFPSERDLPDEKAYDSVKRAIAQRASAQAYRASWVASFAFDDEQKFALTDGELEVTNESESHLAWRTNGRKLELLHHYWMSRAIDEARSDPMAFAMLQGPATDVQKFLAHLRARRDWLQLTEVYGVDSEFIAANGVKVELFVAVRALELLTAFFTLDFAQPYLKELTLRKDWRLALQALAMTGIRPDEFHIRFPLTWSRRRDKIEKLKAWTASEQFPKGNTRVTEAVLDFWTSDLASLRTAVHRDIPELHERPILKLGSFLFQLPWMMTAQNNATASINNLRRLGARRAAVRDETQRIELSLAERMRERGFRVRPNYQPTRTIEDDAGEIDIVCARDGHLFILELKSTYIRRSLEDAWRHRTATLRRAAGQLRRKVAAVMQDLAGPLADLAVDASAVVVHPWIVDTCIEYDHELIDDVLKVSLQEMLIALRDDRELLRDLNEHPGTMFNAQAPSTLYLNGFSGKAFALAIESAAVWENALTPPTSLVNMPPD